MIQTIDAMLNFSYVKPKFNEVFVVNVISYSINNVSCCCRHKLDSV